MYKKRPNSIFPVVALVCAGIAWLAVQRSIEISGSSVWITPMVLFSFLLVALFGSIIFVRSFVHLMMLILAISLGSLFFGASLWQIPHVLFGACLMAIGARTVRRELDLNIKVDIVKSFHSGRSYVVFGLVWIIAAQYFVTIERMDGEKVLPKFDVGKAGGQFLMRSIAVLNPSLDAIKNDEVTVDEFILGSQFFQPQPVDDVAIAEQVNLAIERQYGSQTQVSENSRQEMENQVRIRMTETQNQVLEKNKGIVLSEGRKQLSEMTGSAVTGNEKMYDVFSGFINKKLNDYFNPSVPDKARSAVLPTILSVMLLLTLWPIGSMLGYGCVLIFSLLFLMLRKYSIISIKRLPAEREIIE